MKPRLFLSHSKKDKAFIEKVASDLRVARIDVWYDEWEIPIGESFRQSIVEGISQSDLFFVYLTPHSVVSNWVRLELDAAFVKKINNNKESLALFVNSDETRNQLALDIQSLHTPVFNTEDYLRPLSQLIAKAYESKAEEELIEYRKNHKLEVLELQNQLTGLRLQIAQDENLGNLEKVLAKMQNTEFLLGGKNYTLSEIFNTMKYSLAVSSTESHLQAIVRADFKISPDKKSSWPSFHADTGISFYDILGRLVVFGLVEHLPANGENLETYRLTELGKRVANQ